MARCTLHSVQVERLGAGVASHGRASEEKVRPITKLGDDTSAAAISYVGMDAMRTQLKGNKKKIDDADKLTKTVVMGEVVSTTVALPYPVYNLQALANNKAIDGALKQVDEFGIGISFHCNRLFFR